MGHGNPISIAHPDAGRSPVSPAPVSISPISAVPRSTAIPALESTTPVDLEPEIDPPSQRLASSGEWNKDGGILGRLNFELEPSSAGASTSNVDLTSSVRSSWLRPKAQAPAAEVGAVAGPEQTVAQTAAESHTGDEHEGAGPLRISNDGTSLAETGESVGLPEGALAISLGGKDKGKGKGKTVEHNEEVEQLESPNKTRFWRGKGVPKRRSSRALSVESELRVSYLDSSLVHCPSSPQADDAASISHSETVCAPIFVGAVRRSFPLSHHRTHRAFSTTTPFAAPPGIASPFLVTFPQPIPLRLESIASIRRPRSPTFHRRRVVPAQRVPTYSWHVGHSGSGRAGELSHSCQAGIGGSVGSDPHFGTSDLTKHGDQSHEYHCLAVCGDRIQHLFAATEGDSLPSTERSRVSGVDG
jgi:hypothetical protein